MRYGAAIVAVCLSCALWAQQSSTKQKSDAVSPGHARKITPRPQKRELLFWDENVRAKQKRDAVALGVNGMPSMRDPHAGRGMVKPDPACAFVHPENTGDVIAMGDVTPDHSSHTGNLLIKVRETYAGELPPGATLELDDGAVFPLDLRTGRYLAWAHVRSGHYYLYKLSDGSQDFAAARRAKVAGKKLCH